MHQLTQSMPGLWLLALVALTALLASELSWWIGRRLDARRRARAGRAPGRVNCPPWARIAIVFISLGTGLGSVVLALGVPELAWTSPGLLVGVFLGLVGAGLLAPWASTMLERNGQVRRGDHLGAGDESSGAGSSITENAA